MDTVWMPRDKLRKYAEYEDMTIVGEYSEMKIAKMIQFEITDPLKKCGNKGLLAHLLLSGAFIFYAYIGHES